MDVFLQNLGTLSGWPGLIFLVCSVIFGGLYVHRSTKANADAIARKADKEAIASLQRQLTIQGEEMAAQNVRIRHLEEALKSAGIHVAGDGSITRIHKNEGGKA